MAFILVQIYILKVNKCKEAVINFNSLFWGDRGRELIEGVVLLFEMDFFNRSTFLFKLFTIS